MSGLGCQNMGSNGSHHPVHLLNALMQQRNEHKYCDLKLKFGSSIVSLHSCIAAACSSYIDNVLTNMEYPSGGQSTDLVVDVGWNDLADQEHLAAALSSVVNYMYTGKLTIKDEEKETIGQIAQRLQIETLAAWCAANTRASNLRRSERCQTKKRKTETPDACATKAKKLPVKKQGTRKSLLIKANGSEVRKKTFHVQVCRKPYSCLGCRYQTANVNELVQHLLAEKHAETVCSVCSYEASTSDRLLQHVEQHKHKMPFFCSVCDARFVSFTALNLHVPKHSNQKPYVCDVCKKGFKWKHVLLNHSVVHSKEKQHLCEQCGYRTAHQSSFKAHCLSHTGEKFKCTFPECGFQTLRKQNLQQHVLTHKKQKLFQCEICGQAFSFVKNLRRHARIHNTLDQIMTCDSCHFSTTRSDKMKEHVKKYPSHKCKTSSIPEQSTQPTDSDKRSESPVTKDAAVSNTSETTVSNDNTQLQHIASDSISADQTLSFQVQPSSIYNQLVPYSIPLNTIMPIYTFTTLSFPEQ